MNQVIKSLLPRLSNYSEKLNKKEKLVDKTWYLLRNGSPIEFTFTRDNEVYQSHNNGSVVKGTWKLLSGTNQLYLDLPNEKIMLKQAYVDQNLMILSSTNILSLYVFLNSSMLNKNELEIQRYLEQVADGRKSVTGNQEASDLFFYLPFLIIMFIIIYLIIQSR